MKPWPAAPARWRRCASSAKTAASSFGDLHIARLPLERDRNGQFACAVIDRTEHLDDLRALQDAARTLRESQSFLADAARLSRTGGWSLDAGSGALSASREMCLVFEITGAPPASPEAVLALCAAPSRAALAAALESAVQLDRPFELELDMFSAGGRAMRVRAVGHPEPGTASSASSRTSPASTRRTAASATSPSA